MLNTVLRRLGSAVVTLFVLTLLVQLLVAAMPGDPAAVIAGDQASPEVVQATRERLGLDRPFLGRYVDYIFGAVSGDLGTSLITREPVANRIAAAAPLTVSLLVVSLVLSVVIAIPAGALAALYPGRVDRGISALSSVGLAVPPFVIAFAFLIPLAVNRSLFPAVNYVPLGEDPWQWLRHLILPALALALTPAAEVTRQVRSALTESLGSDFIRTARAGGLGPWSVVGKHAAKNSGIPVVTVLGLQVARVLGGAVVIEQVFAIPGMGTLAFRAVLERDLPVIQGIVLVMGVMVVITNLLVDLSYTYFNPKLRT